VNENGSIKVQWIGRGQPANSMMMMMMIIIIIISITSSPSLSLIIILHIYTYINLDGKKVQFLATAPQTFQMALSSFVGQGLYV